MTLIRLHNDDWGYETNCFVCERRNERGLQIPFFHDTDRQVVTAEFELSEHFSGAPTLVHGGVVLAVLDEAMAWACIAIGHQWAVTSQTSARFHRAVRVGNLYRVDAEVTGHSGTSMSTAAQIVDRHDVVRTEAEATFTTLGEAEAVRLLGDDVGDQHRSYLHDGG